MKNILIIGSSGFIGKNLKKKLKNRFNLICPKSGNKFDIKNKKQLKKFINKDIDIVINLSGQISNNEKKMFNIIVKGNENIIDIIQQLKKDIIVFYFSTTLVYGFSAKVLNEDSKKNPFSKYALFKSIAEKKYVNSKIKFKILRIANVYNDSKVGIVKNI
ncbi:NAD(P)-dependent oxidoreductase, partial [bacterium]|nr:NAD(P)-dependent oxidoreductase [bacterium]